MNLKKFEEFLKAGIVKKQSPNKNRALFLIKEAEQKKQFLEFSLKNLPDDKIFPNFIVDNCYDIIMEMVRAKMLLEGYNSENSHEAEVSYLKYLGFYENDIFFMDELRYYRNGAKYYGTILTREYARKVLLFMKKVYPILKKHLENLGRK